MRGIPPHLPELWRGICLQTYRPARVIFAVESAQDPVHAQLQKLNGGPPVEVVVAGVANQRGQKIHNMLAALARLEPTDAIVIFADSDITPDGRLASSPLAGPGQTEHRDDVRLPLVDPNR